MRPISCAYEEQGIYDMTLVSIDKVGQVVKWRRSRPPDPKRYKGGYCGEHGGDQIYPFLRKCWAGLCVCSPFRVPIARLAAQAVEIRRIAK